MGIGERCRNKRIRRDKTNLQLRVVGLCKGKGLRSPSSGFSRIDKLMPMYRVVGRFLGKDRFP